MHLTYAAPLQEPAGGIAGWATGLVEAMGGPGAGLAIALENLFPPLPSEVILPLAGFAAGQGVISLASALFWTTLGSVVGAVVLYRIGVVFGRERMHAIWGRLPLVKASDLVRTEEWFAKHGTKAVFFGRMVPIFRSLISVPAGVERMPLHLFVVLTTLGSLIWNSVLVLAGYRLGDRWESVETYVGFASKAVLVTVVAAAATFVALRLRGANQAQHRRSS
ncbi:MULTISPECIES: DedA family protein [Streptomyces]|uniref:DedA family protein n=1 Tax=Streptomyces glycanivorans TaxID=3033808 RepID=A0ABY9JCA9_9ACTN|nr:MULTISPECIES: DedA family protein [unclassified Streptomyces]WSQ78148.1 DedA family protein [Streptomyces sp. NBC_01213]TXS17526.1 DedA family protein [Streptomyces sp. wa22]WLQ64765.1 DedA family protein [Streptomyces sp. Alt3]WSQ85520.1 DedA family protein [Streptomyces sp. NBC_01212]WSR08389.1 DedA family protein [Streptomyces sp. NBC_01208]